MSINIDLSIIQAQCKQLVRERNEERRWAEKAEAERDEALAEAKRIKHDHAVAKQGLLKLLRDAQDAALEAQDERDQSKRAAQACLTVLRRIVKAWGKGDEIALDEIIDAARVAIGKVTE